jgi:hypothetical protein
MNDDFQLTINEFAVRGKVDRARVTKLMQDVEAPAKQGRSKLFFLHQYVKALLDDANAGLDLNQERARHAKEQADKLERERLREEGVTLLHEDILPFWLDQISSAKAKFQSARNRAMQKVPPGDRAVVGDVMEACIIEALTELSKEKRA